MSRRDWIFSVSPLFFTFLLDRITKFYALRLEGLQDYGVVSFVLHYNQGIMLGLFSDLPKTLREVTLSTLGITLLFLYILIQYLIPFRSLLLRSGLSFLMGGILGNVYDRIAWGKVVDFIVLGSAGLYSPAFNLADVLQWVGYAMIFTALIREGDLFWPNENTRKKYWVNPSFQTRYSLMLSAICLAITSISSVFAFTYLRISIDELVGHNLNLVHRYVTPFVFSLIVIGITMAIAIFALGKYISHRIAGPIYAFERFLRQALDGEKEPLKLRKGDEFQNLEELSLYVIRRLEELKKEQQSNR